MVERLAQKRGELMMEQHKLSNVIAQLAGKEPRGRLPEQEQLLRHSAVNDEQIKRLKDQIVGLEAEQSRKIAEVLQLRRIREGLEKLREEAKREFVREQERLEQRQSDERTTLSYAKEHVEPAEAVQAEAVAGNCDR